MADQPSSGQVAALAAFALAAATAGWHTFGAFVVIVDETLEIVIDSVVDTSRRAVESIEQVFDSAARWGYQLLIGLAFVYGAKVIQVLRESWRQWCAAKARRTHQEVHTTSLCPLKGRPAGARRMAMLTGRDYIGRFALCQRRAEWDEILVVSGIADHLELIGYTTNTAGTAWVWVVVRPIVDSFRPVEGTDADRAPPLGVQDVSVGWVCPPTDVGNKWVPLIHEWVTIQRDGARLVEHIVANGLAGDRVFVCGADMPAMPEVVLPPVAVVVPSVAGGLTPMGAAAASTGLGFAAAAPPLAALGALGFPAGAAGAGAGALDLKDLNAEIQKIRHQILQEKRDNEKSSSKKKKKDKGTRHRRRDSSSSSGSSRSRKGRGRRKSNRHRKRSGSRSSSSDDMVTWKAQGKNRRLKPQSVRALEEHKFRARGDLLTFAARHPGALSGFFLAMVHQRLSQGIIKNSRDLREVSVQAWAQQHSGLSELRDLREVMTLAAVMDAVNGDALEEAMDILGQRMLAIQQAKKKGGTWEKAEAIELTGSGNGVIAGGLLRLTT